MREENELVIDVIQRDGALPVRAGAQVAGKGSVPFVRELGKNGIVQRIAQRRPWTDRLAGHGAAPKAEHLIEHALEVWKRILKQRPTPRQVGCGFGIPPQGQQRQAAPGIGG